MENRSPSAAKALPFGRGGEFRNKTTAKHDFLALRATEVSKITQIIHNFHGRNSNIISKIFYTL
jgi:hypothetical protein